jgi:hypothetical protein
MDEHFVDPEVMYISACLEQGRWNLLADSLNPDNFETCTRVVRFLDSYAQGHDDVPPVELLNRKFPGFGFMAGVSHTFATSEMHHWLRANKLREVMASSASDIADGRLDAAVAKMREAAVNHRMKRTGRSIADEEMFHTVDTKGIPVAGPILNDLTGGIHPGHYWVTVGKTREGKSWMLMRHAIEAAAAGVDVSYFSLEMTGPACAARLHSIMLGHAPVGMDRNARRNQICQWFEKHNSTIKVIDGHDVGVVTPETVASECGDNRLVIVDYVGLMAGSSGHRSIEDWRVAAGISNSLQAIAQQFRTPIMTAVQANRTAATPNMNSLSQTMAYGQDADVVHIVAKKAQKVTLNILEKNRHGETGAKWFSMFDPAIPDFRDITVERANELIASQEVHDSAYQ